MQQSRHFVRKQTTVDLHIRRPTDIIENSLNLSIGRPFPNYMLAIIDNVIELATKAESYLSFYKSQ